LEHPQPSHILPLAPEPIIKWLDLVNDSCDAHDFFKIEIACHFERSEKSKPSRFLAALEMTVPTPIDEALRVTSVNDLNRFYLYDRDTAGGADKVGLNLLQFFIQL
jgi:hypothetical protein